jgi:hypothetical protein
MTSIQRVLCEDGRTRLTAGFGADELPAVRPSDLERAWDAARGSAARPVVHLAEDPDGVVFSGSSGTVSLDFDDHDAYCWALAIDRLYDLNSVSGLALCFRMLALYKLLEENAWARPLFRLDRRSGLKIDKNLMVAAASQPLTEYGRFDADAMHQETLVAALPPAR